MTRSLTGLVRRALRANRSCNSFTAMRAVIVVAFLVTMLIGNPVGAQESHTFASIPVSQIPHPVRRAHLAQVRAMECGDAHVDYPTRFDEWHRIDLDQDGSPEYLVFITLEGFGGGNNYSRYLIDYRYVEPVWFAQSVLLVGGKGMASVGGERVRLSGNDLSTAAIFYGPDDAMCCASVHGRIHMYVGIGGTLALDGAPLDDNARAAGIMLLLAGACRS